MGSTWRKAKAALALNLCVHSPATHGDEADPPPAHSAAATASSPASTGALTPCSSGLRLPKSGSSRSPKKTCAICLGALKAGQGHALFTAECSHTFHFNCISSNVKHGNLVCPICRAKWKQIPNQGASTGELPHRRSRVNPVSLTQDEGHAVIPHRISRSHSASRQQHNLSNIFHPIEPSTYADDEPVDYQAETSSHSQQQRCIRALDIKTYPEFSPVAKSSSEDNFTVLVHIKAPQADTKAITSRSLHSNQTTRAPVDLVTVLDISGSMAGTKLALLKRAMGFVIQNLGPSDRLSVVSFSSSAHRLFHLRRMSESGRRQALQAVNSLVASGGTNIAAGLRKGAKVLEERKEKNPVCSIMLLSDGQDTYTVGPKPNYHSLVPTSIQLGSGTGLQIPVHTFGFGSDHDSAAMHSIAENSGGTFSFIEAEGMIQDAFAQCIGGLLSVMVQELRVNVECLHPDVRLAPIKSGSYGSQVTDNGRTGSIDVGDLYADEERYFLVSINVPAVSSDHISLLKVNCSYKDPVSGESASLDAGPLIIQRPKSVGERSVSIEVDREKNRVRAAEAMAEARAAAEQGNLSEAVSILEARRRILSESLAGRSGDDLYVSLDAEMKEMQERMASRQRYEASGRAYVLSGLSSHSWQRATARGDSTDSASLVHMYQTQSMVDMVSLSQIMSPAAFRQPNPTVRPTKSSASSSSRSPR